VRKVTERGCGRPSSERFYVGGFEVFREFSGREIATERETLHIMDDKQRIALVETRTIEDGDPVHAPTSEQRYQLANPLGSASVEVDEAGGLITYEEYTAANVEAVNKTTNKMFKNVVFEWRPEFSSVRAADPGSHFLGAKSLTSSSNDSEALFT